MKNRLLLFFLAFYSLQVMAEVTAVSRDGIVSIALSPDGRHFAFLNRISDADTIIVVRIQDAAVVVHRELESPKRFLDLHWVDDSTLVMQRAHDRQYEVEPQPIGDIELVNLQGKFWEITGDHSEELFGHHLMLVDSLPLSPETLLVRRTPNQNLILIDTQFRVLQSFDSPNLLLPRLMVSQNLRYMIASGTDENANPQVVGLSTVSSDGWIPYNSVFEPISISNFGDAFGTAADAEGVLGLVKYPWNSANPVTLFRDSDHSVDLVLFDSNQVPYAVRFQVGYPSWIYIDSNNRLSEIHKSLRAGLPDTDVSIVSTNSIDSRAIARIAYDSKPHSYFLINTLTGQAQHIVDSPIGLHVSGGDPTEDYQLQPFFAATDSGREISGFISSPKDSSLLPMPTVVYIHDTRSKSYWQWGYDPEIAYLNSLGINVLIINYESPPNSSERELQIDSVVTEVEEAIRWSIEEEFSRRTDNCIVGRGSAAGIALLVAIRNSEISCAISFEGDFFDTGLLESAAVEIENHGKKLDVLFVYGGASPEYIALHMSVQNLLSANGVDISAKVIPGEMKAMSLQTNYATALANIGSFIVSHTRGTRFRASLPMTYEQALVFSQIVQEYQRRVGGLSSQSRIDNYYTAINWLNAQDRNMRSVLSEDQFPLYERLKEIITYRRGTWGLSEPPPRLRTRDTPTPRRRPNN